MDNPYERYWDRETRMHFERQHAKGPFYGVIVDVENTDLSELVQDEMQMIVVSKARVMRDKNTVYFSGPISERMLKRIDEYVTSHKGMEARSFRGQYEHFVGNPRHWIERYPGHKVNHIAPVDNIL